jgi:hypothetical protein
MVLGSRQTVKAKWRWTRKTITHSRCSIPGYTAVLREMTAQVPATSSCLCYVGWISYPTGEHVLKFRRRKKDYGSEWKFIPPQGKRMCVGPREWNWQAVSKTGLSKLLAIPPQGSFLCTGNIVENFMTPIVVQIRYRNYVLDFMWFMSLKLLNVAILLVRSPQVDA